MYDYDLGHLSYSSGVVDADRCSLSARVVHPKKIILFDWKEMYGETLHGRFHRLLRRRSHCRNLRYWKSTFDSEERSFTVGYWLWGEFILRAEILVVFSFAAIFIITEKVQSLIRYFNRCLLLLQSFIVGCIFSRKRTWAWRIHIKKTYSHYSGLDFHRRVEKSSWRSSKECLSLVDISTVLLLITIWIILFPCSFSRTVPFSFSWKYRKDSVALFNEFSRYY